LRRSSCLLGENLQNDDCVWIHPINDPPDSPLVGYSQFVTPRSDRGHRPGMGHSQTLTSLQSP
jgi:hypothetical protein